MRPIAKGIWPTKGAKGISKRVFNQWQRAIPHLENRTGKFCHLCEMRVTNALAIEHIKPKDHFSRLSVNWNNFLLICNYCNSHKKAKIPDSPYRKKYYWPQFNNTLMAFDFKTSGEIIPNIKYLTTNQELDRAKATIELYGLDKTHTADGDSDTRLMERLEALYFAIKRLKEYQAGINTSIDPIVDLAKTKGFFSVWLKVFNGEPKVRAALINCPEFYLTSTNCFDVTLQLKKRTILDI